MSRSASNSWRPNCNGWAKRFVDRWKEQRKLTEPGQGPQNRCSYRLIAFFGFVEYLWQYRFKGVAWYWWLTGGISLASYGISIVGLGVWSGLRFGTFITIMCLMMIGLIFFLFRFEPMRPGRFSRELRSTNQNVSTPIAPRPQKSSSKLPSTKATRSRLGRLSMIDDLTVIVLHLYFSGILCAWALHDFHHWHQSFVLGLKIGTGMTMMVAVALMVLFVESNAQQKFEQQWGYEADRPLTRLCRLAYFIARKATQSYNKVVATYQRACPSVDYCAE